MISAYERLEPLAKPRSQRCRSFRGRGAAVHADPARRLAQRAAGAKVAPKNPLEYRDKLRFHQRVRSAADYGLMR